MFHLIILSLIFTTLVSAQTEQEVIDLNDQIRETVLTRQIDPRTLERVRGQLEQILYQLDRNAPADQAEIKNLKCVSRDNDQAAPYIFATELRDFTLRRYPEYRFSSLGQCQSSADSARVMAGGLHTCVSRDNDGASPFSIVSFYGDKVTKRPVSFRALNQCQDAIQHARANYDAWIICIARDNDGSAPWIKMVVKRDGTSARQDERFPSLEACINN